MVLKMAHNFVFVIFTLGLVIGQGEAITITAENFTCSHIGMCYHTSGSGRYTYPQATKYCSDLSLSLPVAMAEADNDFLVNTTRSLTKQFWLNMLHVTRGIWVIHTSPARQITWTNWFTSQRWPEPNGGELAKCAYLNTANGRWFDSFCNTFMNNVVCQKQVKCPPGWIAGPGVKCYSTFTSPKTLTYSQSKNICVGHLKASLATPTNEAHNDFLVGLSKHDFVIDLPQTGSNWTNWDTNTTDQSTDQCVIVKYVTGKWRHVTCDDAEVKHVTCEKDADVL